MTRQPCWVGCWLGVTCGGGAESVASLWRAARMINIILSYVFAVLTGVLTGSLLVPLLTNNANSAVELRKKIQEVLRRMDQYQKVKPGTLREQLFEELSSDLKQALVPVRWYPIFKFLLGLPSNHDVRAAIEKLSEMTRCLRAIQPDGHHFDLERRAQA
jgi:hypothetical protein